MYCPFVACVDSFDSQYATFTAGVQFGKMRQITHARFCGVLRGGGCVWCAALMIGCGACCVAALAWGSVSMRNSHADRISVYVVCFVIRLAYMVG